MANTLPLGMQYSQDPDVAKQMQELALRQQVAQAMMAQGMQPVSTQGREIGGMGYKVSPFEGLNKVLQAYLGTKMGMQNADSQGNLMSQAYRSALAANQPGADAGYSPDQVFNAGQDALKQGAAEGDIGPTNTNAQRMAKVLAAQRLNPAVTNPRNPLRAPAELLTAYQLGLMPKEQFDAQMALYKPTESTITARQANQDPVAANAAALAKANTDPKILAMKQAGFSDAQIYQALYAETAKASDIERRPQQFFENSFTGARGIVPKLPEGVNPTGPISPNAIVPGVTPIGGSQPAIYGNARAGAGGAASGSIQMVTTPDGRQIPIRGENAVGGMGMPNPGASNSQGPQVAASSAPPMLAPQFGQSTANANIQKTASDAIAQAPQSIAISRSSITGLEAAQRALQNVPATGPGTVRTMDIIAALNNAGVPLNAAGVNNYQSLSKYLSNSLNQAAAGTNSSGSDARFESFMHGQPNQETMSKEALGGAIRYVLSQHDAALARGNILMSEYQKTRDPLQAQAAASEAIKPQFFAYNRMTPEEKIAYQRSLGKDKALAFSHAFDAYPLVQNAGN